MRTEVIQTAVRTLLRQVRFRPFALNMENGDRIVIEQPENIAFDPGDNGSPPALRLLGYLTATLFHWHLRGGDQRGTARHGRADFLTGILQEKIRNLTLRLIARRVQREMNDLGRAIHP